MNPDIQEIVARFKRLDTSSARRTAIHQIIEQLGPHEWRDVKKRINERSFQKDILGELPLEIAVQIARYLNLGEFHVLRRVSRRWYDILCSKPACSAMFRQYTGDTLNDLDGSYKSAFTHYSKHRQRLELGNPFERRQIDLPPMNGQDILVLDYSNGRCAWTTDDDTTIMVHDLCSSKTQRFCTKNRERLQKVRLSKLTLAAVTAHGYCHLWSLLTEESHAVRLPNSNISLFVLCGFRIALCFRTLCTDLTEDSFVMHYDFQSRTTHTKYNIQRVTVIVLSPSSNHLTTICLERPGDWEPTNSPRRPQLRVVEYQLLSNGDASVARTYALGLPLPIDWAYSDFGIKYDLQDDCRNRLGILYARPAFGISAPQLILLVAYHPQSGSICVHTLPEHQVSRPLCVTNVDKDILYYIKNDDGKRSIWVSNPYAETPHCASRSMDLGLPRDLSDGVSLFTHPYRMLAGDSRFVFMIDATGVRMWSFEKGYPSGDRKAPDPS
ncbi:F-box domain protein [Aspergillus lucknowensis]|uniref:F-box domain-containing protein n=1 Tax=Aspergillus lucknowensis TaxID=176173 RepID=A0ABR4LQW1_9EURO